MNLKIPPIVFKIIWPILYFLLFLSILFIYQLPNSKFKSTQIYLFWFSIFFNLLWIFLYFYLELKIIAFIDLCIMIILLIVLLFYSIPSKKSTLKVKFIFLSFLIYFFWLLVAFYLSVMKLKEV
jgi:tryptophan-rich sensory protein